jgi:heme/copper-type cytochrome/quinol oxidase subunit 4
MQTSSIIEQLDKSRHKAIKWFAVGWAMWFGLYLISYWAIISPIFKAVFLVTGLTGWIIWTIHLVKIYRLGRIVSSDEALRNALNDEYHQQNTYKSFVVGYAVTLTTIVILIVVAAFFEIPAAFALHISLYLGVLSALLAALFYNKDS